MVHSGQMQSPGGTQIRIQQIVVLTLQILRAQLLLNDPSWGLLRTREIQNHNRRLVLLLYNNWLLLKLSGGLRDYNLLYFLKLHMYTRVPVV